MQTSGVDSVFYLFLSRFDDQSFMGGFVVFFVSLFAATFILSYPDDIAEATICLIVQENASA